MNNLFYKKQYLVLKSKMTKSEQRNICDVTNLRNQNLTTSRDYGNPDNYQNNTRYRLALDGTFLMLHIDTSSWILLTWSIKKRLISQT